MADFVVGNKYSYNKEDVHYQCCGFDLKGRAILHNTSTPYASVITVSSDYISAWKEVRTPREVWVVIESDGTCLGVSIDRQDLKRWYKILGPDSYELVHFKEVLDD